MSYWTNARPKPSTLDPTILGVPFEAHLVSSLPDRGRHLLLLTSAENALPIIGGDPFQVSDSLCRAYFRLTGVPAQYGELRFEPSPQIVATYDLKVSLTSFDEHVGEYQDLPSDRAAVMVLPIINFVAALKE
jgi:hypothetical protein